MKSKSEQAFCTKLANWLKKTNHPQSMLVECKVTENPYFKVSDIRGSQTATFNRLLQGLPIAHKISDKGSGSKLVDLIYISPKNTQMKPYVAVKIKRSAYLVPFQVISPALGRIPEAWWVSYRIW